MPSYLSDQKRTKLLPSGPVEIGIVLDRSSSMKHLCKAVVDGFNMLLAEQQKLTVPIRFSLSFFNDEVVSVHDGAPIGGVAAMELADYSPEGSTALLDAIGALSKAIGARVDPSPYPARVLIAILTDGMENASVRFSKQEVFELISFRRAACNWQFLFMGAGSQTVQTGLSLGIQRSNIVEFGADPEGIAKVMLALSGAFRAYQVGDRGFALLLKEGER